MKWAYGVMTTPERKYNYLPKTLESLKAAGFDTPMLFVDGSDGDFSEFNLPVVKRSSRILAFGNWLLALVELWIRYPFADRYAIFQDDFVTYKNLRNYLDRCELSDRQYWNLLTFPENENLNLNKATGWYLSNQMGRGAVGLVFSRNVVFNILLSPYIMSKPAAAENAHRSIDGTLVTGLAKAGIKETVHHPTLIWHTGDCSSVGNPQHKKPASFLGEEYDAMNFLPQLIPAR